MIWSKYTHNPAKGEALYEKMLLERGINLDKLYEEQRGR